MVAIAEVMTADPVCVRASSTLERCLRQLTAHGLRHLPVTDDHGRLIGMVHDFQVLRHCERRGRTFAIAAKHADVPAIRVAVSAGRTLSPEGRLVDALDVLAQGWEDAVVVVDELRYPVGIFTVTDALWLAPSWLTPWWRVRQAMTRTETSMPLGTLARDALRWMWKQQRAHALVRDGIALAGTVSLRSLVAIDPRSKATLHDVVGNRAVRSVGPDTSLVDAARLLGREGGGCVPVLDHERPVGLFTSRDLLRALRRTVNVASTKAS